MSSKFATMCRVFVSLPMSRFLSIAFFMYEVTWLVSHCVTILITWSRVSVGFSSNALVLLGRLSFMCCLSSLYLFSISSRAHITMARYIWFQLISPYNKFRSSMDFMNLRCHSSNVAHLGACNENISTLMMSHTITSRVACWKCSLMICSAYTPRMSSGTFVRAW